MAFVDIFDILLFSVFVYGLIMLLKQTRSLFVVYGIIIVFGIYGVAQAFSLRLTSTALSLFFSVFLLGLVIIFQAELRRYFEMIAIYLTSRTAKAGAKPKAEDIDHIVRVALRFSKEKVGMLLVFTGHEAISRHVQGGFPLGGKISEPILESIFDASSPGHDGVVVIENGTIVRFGAHLPLSQDFGQIEAYGTRHSAGLGIAEVSDALALVVSEEKGTISVARDGKLTMMKSEADLRTAIQGFMREKYGRRKAGVFHGFTENIPEKVLAVLLAGVAWVALIMPHAR